MFEYSPNSERYDGRMPYRRCGVSGLQLPLISLGLWHNFGSDDLAHHKRLIFHAFDLGVTHFDLANNYGEIPGSAEANFGKILGGDLKAYRNELSGLVEGRLPDAGGAVWGWWLTKVFD